MSSLTRFTCLSCRVAFAEAEEQRMHYKSDWHRYNLKRRSADLPVITQAEFTMKFSNMQANSQTDKAISTSSYCSSCKKSFASEKTYQQHLVSKKHLEMQTQEKAPSKGSSNPSTLQHSMRTLKISEGASEAEIAQIIERNLENAPRLSLTDCLFCNSHFDELTDLMQHMTGVHSFYIPDLDYLNDLQGLLKFLGEQISVYNCCIYCNERCRAYKSLEAVRKHMIDKGHCRIYFNPEEELEIFQFYDYSDFYETDEEENGEGCTEMSITSEQPYISSNESEMILPSGKSIGNRAYKIYYKQYLPFTEEHESFAIKRLHDHYKAIGFSCTPDAAHAAAIQRKQAERNSKFAYDVGLRNSGLQRHFRAQIL